MGTDQGRRLRRGRHIAWLRGLVDAVQPVTTGGVYLNFVPDERGSRIDAERRDRTVDGFGREKYARLVALKRKYDPTNMFRFNHNISSRHDAG